MPSRHPLVDKLQIAVEHHDGIVNHHAEHYNQASQGACVEWYANEVHYADGDKCAERHHHSGHHGSAPREEYEHHHYDDKHRLQQINHKVVDAAFHYLALVGYAAEGDIGRKLIGGEVIEHSLHILAILHYVVALHHFKAEKHTGVAVVLYVAFVGVVFAFHLSYVLEPYHMVLRVGEDDMVFYLLLTVY